MLSKASLHVIVENLSLQNVKVQSGVVVCVVVVVVVAAVGENEESVVADIRVVVVVVAVVDATDDVDDVRCILYRCSRKRYEIEPYRFHLRRHILHTL
ncbi:Hypothetical predicted protein [Octopus vulgaris]|uniref:Uncharacterized protein n=1 Tax=Octopus vulgaris TaxID=6645 RepID=A0AA36AV15_OCTVU|nr:Hypothetical predicted protein [Octopus vulgaris]